MGLEFLARVRRTTLWLGAVTALLTGTYRTPLAGLALALGVAWSLVNLWLLERLVVALTGPGRGTVAGLRGAGGAALGMTGLFAAGAALLLTLSPIALLVGFLVPFAVLVLKAATMLVLDTPLWRRFVSQPRRAGIAIAVVALAAWAALSIWPLPSAVPAGAAGEHAVAAQGAHAAAAAEHGGEREPQKFASFITVITRAFPDAAWAHRLHQWETPIFALIVGLILVIVARLATRNPQMIPGPLQNVVEWIVEALYDFVVGILGPRYGPRFVPFLGTQFVYILAMNLFGLIPFMESPTSSLNVTFGLAVVVFFYAQYLGVRELGPLGYLDHMAGNPRTIFGWVLAPLMLLIHSMGEIAKPISLSARLFGNVFGEDMLLVAFASLGVSVLAFTHLPFGLPLQLPFLFLAMFTSALQALVFTVLSTVYFLLMLPHDEHAQHDEAIHHAV